jgi:hypothetical protein
VGRPERAVSGCLTKPYLSEPNLSEPNLSEPNLSQPGLVMTRLSRALVIGFCVLYGLIAFATGGLVMVGGAEAGADPMTDNTFRFLAAIWVGVGVGFFTCAWRYRTETTLFRVLMVALFLGGIGRSTGLLHYPATTELIALIALELVPPLFLVPMQARLARSADVNS